MSDDEHEFVVAFSHREQVGVADRTGLEGIQTRIFNGELMSSVMSNMGSMMSPMDKIVTLTSMYYDKLGGDGSFAFTWESINYKIETIRHNLHRNPVGIALGARCLDVSGNIDIDRFKATILTSRALRELESIEPEDVLRYAKLMGGKK